MPSLSRRGFLAAVTTTLGTSTLARTGWSGEQLPPPKAVPMLHTTDLFRPHADPDDHWDLACIYALAYQGCVDLRGVLIDYPPRGRDPDVLAVAQMNYLTGKAVAAIVGTPQHIDPRDAAKPENAAALRGVRAVLEILRRSPEPVVIDIGGTCRDVATAARLEPELFARKCAAIYLNAGSGTPDKSKAVNLECNVNYDPQAYAALFEVPCPVYWAPCVEVIAGPYKVSEYGTFFCFRQGDVLPGLSDRVQNYFAYVFKHGALAKNQAGDVQPDWLQYLVGAKDLGLLARVNAMQRGMYGVGGFLHATGMTVSGDGRIVPLSQAKDPVFTFDPIDVKCSAQGVTEWRHDPAATKRFIFHVRDQERYPRAMTAALKSLLSKLP